MKENGRKEVENETKIVNKRDARCENRRKEIKKRERCGREYNIKGLK